MPALTFSISSLVSTSHISHHRVCVDDAASIEALEKSARQVLTSYDNSSLVQMQSADAGNSDSKQLAVLLVTVKSLGEHLVESVVTNCATIVELKATRL